MALSNGAQGIGLCRTEHMFFATAQRIAAVRRMIAAVELHSPFADEALAELQKYQQAGEGGGLGGPDAWDGRWRRRFGNSLLRAQGCKRVAQVWPLSWWTGVGHEPPCAPFPAAHALAPPSLPPARL